MRRLPALALIVLIAAALAACSAGATPGWTYAPAASATPAPSGAASGAPSAGAPSAAPSAGAPSAAPSAAQSAAASGGTGAGLTVKAPMGAATGGFDPTTLETTAGTAFTLTFDNEDNQAPHNLALFGSDGAKVALGGDTAFFTGPGQRQLQVPALTAGTYTYKCEVHPSTMMGTLTVK